MAELNGYTAALDDLWDAVLPTLTALELLAAEPDRLAFADLAAHQYSLHRSAELAAGLAHPAGSEGPHVALAEALESARDATSIVAAALEEGGMEAAGPLVWEWRGALFVVRLSELRLAESASAAHAVPEDADPFRRQLSTTALVLVGATIALVLLVLSALPLSN